MPYLNFPLRQILVYYIQNNHTKTKWISQENLKYRRVDKIFFMVVFDTQLPSKQTTRHLSQRIVERVG